MSNLGTLSLPQLGECGNPIIINNICREDAEGLIKNLTERVKTSRKLKNYTAGVEDAFFEVNAIGSNTHFNSHDEDYIIELLAESNIPTLRGERAVFFEYDKFVNGEPAAFLIGTTVIYNANWATLGVLDLSVVDLLDRETYDEEEEDEDEDCDECEDEEEDDDDADWCYACQTYH
jgi:hypothetical protein